MIAEKSDLYNVLEELGDPQRGYSFEVLLPDLGSITGKTMSMRVSKVEFVGPTTLNISFFMSEDLDKDFTLTYLKRWLEPQNITVQLENSKGDVVRLIKCLDCTFVRTSFAFNYSNEGCVQYVAEFKLSAIGMSKP